MEEWEIQNCFLELEFSSPVEKLNTVFNYCLSMEFLLSSGNFIPGYFCTQLRMVLLQEERVKGVRVKGEDAASHGDKTGRGMWATNGLIAKKTIGTT